MIGGFFSSFSPEQLRAGYARNAIGLRLLLARAERTGRKVNGFTADALRERVAEYKRLSVATDGEILAHVRRPIAS